MSVSKFSAKAKQYVQLLTHVKGPFRALLMRLGFIDVPQHTFRIRKGGITYTMTGRPRRGDLWLLRELLIEETYGPLLQHVPARPLRIVDVGAHIGAFTVWLHRHRGVQEGYCFEPDPASFALCEVNLRANGCEHVQLRREALGGSTCQAEIWIDEVTNARSTLHKRASSTETHATVQVVSFGEWMAQVSGDFDVLKLDCEGSEWDILEAAPQALKRFAIIVAEIHAHPKDTRQTDEFPRLLQELGFETVAKEKLYIGRRESRRLAVAN